MRELALEGSNRAGDEVPANANGPLGCTRWMDSSAVTAAAGVWQDDHLPPTPLQQAFTQQRQQQQQEGGERSLPPPRPPPLPPPAVPAEQRALPKPETSASAQQQLHKEAAAAAVGGRGEGDPHQLLEPALVRLRAALAAGPPCLAVACLEVASPLLVDTRRQAFATYLLDAELSGQGASDDLEDRRGGQGGRENVLGRGAWGLYTA